jgi:hypothetical protein
MCAHAHAHIEKEIQEPCSGGAEDFRMVLLAVAETGSHVAHAGFKLPI